jgi:hypothetical protein
VKAVTIGIRTVADYSIWLKDHQQVSSRLGAGLAALREVDAKLEALWTSVV